jgi:hypothetical protein
MWRRKQESVEPGRDEQQPSRLREAVHKARVEQAERTSVVVDLRDAEVARLELLNEALAPLFGDIPQGVDLFDRGISRGETPRLWIDAVTHVAMGRDKRVYHLLQDTRIGRRVLAESREIVDIVEAITGYVARRLVERERALAEDPGLFLRVARSEAARERRRRRWRGVRALLLGFVLGLLALFAAAWLVASQF